MNLNDLAGNLISAGSVVVDDSGRLWKVYEDDPIFYREGILPVHELRMHRGRPVLIEQHTYKHIISVFVVKTWPATQKERSRLYYQIRKESSVDDRLRKEINKRRDEMQARIATAGLRKG